MRTRILAVVMAAALALALAVAPAQAGHGKLDRKANSLRAQVVKRFGAQAAGRDIIRQGVRTKHGRKAASRALKLRYVGVLDRTLHPPPPVIPRLAQPTPSSVGAPASSSSGYCGAYQFDAQTWQSVGGSGTACGASPAEQDERATILMRQRGTSPWPNCGSRDLAAIRQCENSGSYR